MDTEAIQALSQTFSNINPSSTRVTVALREAILGGLLKPKTKITEEMVAKLFDVSRTPAREAIRVIESEGLLVNIPRFGSVVKEWSLQDFIDLYRVASELEGLSAALASESRIPRNAELQMRDLIEKIKLSSLNLDRALMEQYNYEFHIEIARCTENLYLLDALDKPISKIRMIRPMIFPPVDDVVTQAERVYRDHLDLLDAILRGDTETARRLGKNHIAQSSEYAVKLFREHSKT